MAIKGKQRHLPAPDAAHQTVRHGRLWCHPSRAGHHQLLEQDMYDLTKHQVISFSVGELDGKPAWCVELAVVNKGRRKLVWKMSFIISNGQTYYQR
jgi:hypothetical protein